MVGAAEVAPFLVQEFPPRVYSGHNTGRNNRPTQEGIPCDT
jgi:hypothetical protein